MKLYGINCSICNEPMFDTEEQVVIDATLYNRETDKWRHDNCGNENK